MRHSSIHEKLSLFHCENDDTFRQTVVEYLTRQGRHIGWSVLLISCLEGTSDVSVGVWRQTGENSSTIYVTEYQAWPVTAQTCLYQHNTSVLQAILHLSVTYRLRVQHLFWHFYLTADVFYGSLFSSKNKMRYCCIATDGLVSILTTKLVVLLFCLHLL